MNWLVICAVSIYALLCIATIIAIGAYFARTPKNLRGYYCIPLMVFMIAAMAVGGIALTLACLG